MSRPHHPESHWTFIQKVKHPEMSQSKKTSFRNFIKKVPLDVHSKFANVNLITRFIWTLTYFASIASFVYYFHGIFIKWYFEPDISITIRNIPVHEVPFPAVTFCTPYVISDELANFSDYRIRTYLNEEVPEYSDSQREYLGTMLELCMQSHQIGVKMFSSNPHHRVIRCLNESRQKYDLVTGYCSIESTMYDCQKMFNVVPTHFGLCYSFNMQGYSTIFHKGVLHSDFDFYKRKTIAKALHARSKLYNQTVDDDNETVHWTLQDGYLTKRVDAVPYRLSKNVISLYLGFKNLSFYPCFGENFVTYYHLPNEVPMATKNIIRINFPSFFGIAVEARSITRNKNLQKYSPEIRQCFFDGEKNLQFFRTYTKGNCDFECLTNYTLKVCKCVRFFMPRTPQTKVCNLTQLVCAAEAYRKIEVYKIKIDKYPVPCNCLPPCNEIKYSFRNMKSDPADDANPIVKVFVKSNISTCTNINVFTGNLEVEQQEYFVAYTLQNLIADVGGLLGLFMGYSFLSIAEFVQKLMIYLRAVRNDRVRPYNTV